MLKTDVEKIISNILKDGSFTLLGKVSGGMMNESYTFSYNNKTYIIYLPFGNANDMVDRDLEKDNQRICIDLGITSSNLYFDVNTGIKVNEYLLGTSLDKVSEYDVNEVAKLMHVLHASKKLSKEEYHPFKRLREYENARKGFTLETDSRYDLIRNYLFDHEQYLKDNEVLVLSHNDAQKSNIVLGDDNHYYFIDFEFMANNDEEYDIAAFGNGSVKEGYELLKAYYPNLDTTKIRKYYLWRLFISLQWYNVALSKHYNDEGAMHGYNFLDVASHFFNNAYECYLELKK